MPRSSDKIQREIDKLRAQGEKEDSSVMQRKERELRMAKFHEEQMQTSCCYRSQEEGNWPFCIYCGGRVD